MSPTGKSLNTKCRPSTFITALMLVTLRAPLEADSIPFCIATTRRQVEMHLTDSFE